MNFLEFPTEIRFNIYSELLVVDETIVFVASHGPRSPPLLRYKSDGLCPALLRVSKRVYHEASPLLYSNNRFRFPQAVADTSFYTDGAHIAPFLYQIGSQASLVHNICIGFPSFEHPQSGGIKIREEHVKNLELIRDICTSIRTLELFVSPDHNIYALSHSEIAVEAIHLLDTRFKTIPSLKEITVNFEVHPEEDPDDDIRKRMYDRGWAVKITRLPKRVWISDDDRIEFDNKEDCIAYNNEQFRRKEEREREREEELWREEYYRRRDDPYWKNDSDYD